MNRSAAADAVPNAAEVLRTVVAATAGAPDGRLAELLAEAVDHLAGVLRDQPRHTVAAVAVPVAVFGRLSPGPVPAGLLACAAATYLAFDALDDQADGERSAVWPDRSPTEVVLGAQQLLLTANRVVAGPLATHHHELVTASMEGQLRTEVPISSATSPAEVAATISARSGSMLAGFAAMAAVAAGGTDDEVDAARTFGRELGVARQHVNDLTELVGERTTDLRNGTATMALALALQPLRLEEREALLLRVRAAADDVATRRRLVTAELAPSVAEVCLLIQLHLAQARSAGSRLRRAGVVHDGVDRLIASTAASLRSPSVRP